MCTSLRILAHDGTPVIGRTMEFPSLLDAALSVVPRGIALASVAAGAGPGLSWQTVHGLVGVNAFASIAAEGPIGLTDGVNEHGLYGALLYMPGFCDFGDTTDAPEDVQLIPTHVIAYALSTCTSVAQVREALTKVRVCNWVDSPVPLTVHFRFDDASGAGVVVEWQDGEMVVHDNPIGVMTNAPYFDWHITNLRNYINLQAANPAGASINGVTLDPLGVGEGMRGLPGDATPPGRFVRAAAYTATVTLSADGPHAENSMLHVINNFDLVPGFAVSDARTHETDQTQWSTISNLRDATYSLRTHGDVTFRKLALSDLDFTGTAVTTHPLPGAAGFPSWTL